MKTVTYVINSITLAVVLSTLTFVAKVQADSSFSVNSTYADTHGNNGTHYEESRSLSSNEDTHDDLTLSALHETQSTVDISDDAVSEDIHTNEVKKTLDDTHANSAHANSESSAIYPKKISQVPYSALGVLPTSEADEQFSYGDDPIQTIYTWHGRSSTNEKYADKALIFIHGGCWLNAYGYEHAKGMYHALAELGMGVYVTEYRRVGDEGGGWPGSLDDVTQAIRTALKRIENEGRYTNIYIAGHSAGGHFDWLHPESTSFDALLEVISEHDE